MQRFGFIFIVMCAMASMASASDVMPRVNPVSPKEFLKLSQEKGAVILDVRDASDPREMVIKKAIPLPAREITEAKALEVAPDKSAPLLLICNYSLMPEKKAMETRALSAISFASPTLQSYGYKHVYSLKNAHTAEAFKMLQVIPATKEQY